MPKAGIGRADGVAMSTRNEPTYVFCLTHDLALRWMSLSVLLFFVTVAGISAFYEAIHGRSLKKFRQSLLTYQVRCDAQPQGIPSWTLRNSNC